jgi:hypothetical protein
MYRARASVCVHAWCEVHRVTHSGIRMEMNGGKSGELATCRCLRVG